MAQAVSGGSDSQIPVAGRAVAESLYAENRACALRMRACHGLYEICEDEHFEQLFAAGYDPEFDDRKDYAVVDPYDVAASEIVAAYGVHLHRARAMLNLGRTLVEKFPAVLEAMEVGWLDERTAEMLTKQMRTVSGFHRSAVQKDVIDWLRKAIDSGRRPGRSAILNQTDSIINGHDPQGVLARREAAFDARSVQVRRGADGMSVLRANLSSMDASAILALLQDAARKRIAQEKAARALASRNGEDTDHWHSLTPDQHRADALVEAFLGPRDTTEGNTNSNSSNNGSSGGDNDNGSGSGSGSGGADVGTSTSGAGAGARGGAGPQLRPLITVFAPLGPDDEPEVYLPRGGQSSIEALIALLSRSVGAGISVPDTAEGTADCPHGARRYRISTELARRIRLRDGTCRHPGCSVPADDCDVDHVRPFSHNDPANGGPTIESNLMCLCRRHHRFKTFHDWHYTLSRDGTLTIRTSTGHTITTEPDGPLARWRQKTASRPMSNEDPLIDEDPLAEPGPVRQPSPFGPDPKPQPTHWLQRAKRLAAQRRAHTATRRPTPPTPPNQPRNGPETQPEQDPPPF